MNAGVGALKSGSAMHFIAEQGIKASDHHEGTMVEAIDKHTWITMSMDRAVGNVQSRLQDGMAFLATVGSTAPFVGLFGTVWGIYNALVKIGISGQASIDKVAGPVGEALIMTAIGLAVAVPAVMGYNWLLRRNKARDGPDPRLRRRPAQRAARRQALMTAPRRLRRRPPRGANPLGAARRGFSPLQRLTGDMPWR